MRATKFSQYLQHREELQYVDKPHWIYLIGAFVWASLIIMAGFWLDSFVTAKFLTYPQQPDNSFDSLLSSVALWTGFIVKCGAIAYATLHLINRIVFYSSTYVFASDRRLYMKTGLLRVRVFDVSFEEIHKTDINYGFFGRFLGYGKLELDSRFVSDTENLPFISKPELFMKLIHYDNDLNQDINLSFVTRQMHNNSRANAIEPLHQKEQIVDNLQTQTTKLGYRYPSDDMDPSVMQHEKQQGLDEKIHHDFDEAIDKQKPAHDPAMPSHNPLMKENHF